MNIPPPPPPLTDAQSARTPSAQESHCSSNGWHHFTEPQSLSSSPSPSPIPFPLLLSSSCPTVWEHRQVSDRSSWLSSALRAWGTKNNDTIIKKGGDMCLHFSYWSTFFQRRSMIGLKNSGLASEVRPRSLRPFWIARNTVAMSDQINSDRTYSACWKKGKSSSGLHLSASPSTAQMTRMWPTEKWGENSKAHLMTLLRE